MFKKNNGSGFLTFFSLLLFVVVAVLAEDLPDASIFSSGAAGTDSKTIENMLEKDSGGILAPGSLEMGYVVSNVSRITRDTNKTLLKKCIDSIEREYKLYLSKNAGKQVQGEVKVQIAVTGSGTIIHRKILKSTLQNKTIESIVLSELEKIRIESGEKDTVKTVTLKFFPGEQWQAGN